MLETPRKLNSTLPPGYHIKVNNQVFVTYEKHSLQAGKGALLQILHVAQHVNALVRVCKVAVAEVLLEASDPVAHVGIIPHHFHLQGGLEPVHEGHCVLAHQGEPT